MRVGSLEGGMIVSNRGGEDQVMYGQKRFLIYLCYHFHF
jgi:hypothetical protein